jgi:transcriptional accessory protein Tex/SPT6
MTFLQSISRRLQRSEDQLKLPSELLRQGYDPTFLATYRADEVGQLDRQALESLQRTLLHSDAVDAHRMDILKLLEEEDTKTDAITRLLARIETVAELDLLTRGLRSKKGSRAIASKTPRVLDAVEALLTYEGEPPADVEKWLSDKFEVPEDQVGPFHSQVRRMLQCLLQEDVPLIEKIANEVRRKMVLSVKVLPEPSQHESDSAAAKKEDASAKAETNATPDKNGETQTTAEEPNTSASKTPAGASTASDSTASTSAENPDPTAAAMDSSNGGAEDSSSESSSTTTKPLSTSSGDSNRDAVVAPTVTNGDAPNQDATAGQAEVAATKADSPEADSPEAKSAEQVSASAAVEGSVASAAPVSASTESTAATLPDSKSSDSKSSDAETAANTPSSDADSTKDNANASPSSSDLAVDGFAEKSGSQKRRRSKSGKSGVDKASKTSESKLSPRQRRRRWLRSVLEGFSKLREPLANLSAYQILMLGRGQRSQIIDLQFNYDRKMLLRLGRDSLATKDHPLNAFLDPIANDTVEKLILPRIESDLLAESEELAQQTLMDSAIGQLDEQLMRRPVAGKPILCIDAIGNKMAAVAVIDASGKVLHTDELPSNSSRSTAVSRNVVLLGEVIYKFGVEVVVISSGPARRYLIHTLKELMAQSASGSSSKLHWTMVDRSGVDAYCATRLALKELPEHSKRHRAAIWLARRVQDPLRELLKIDPARLRLGSYQRELPQDELRDSLNRAFQAARASQGVDFWNAEKFEFERLPGIDDDNAERLLAIRYKNEVASRELIKAELLPYLGETDMRQAIGFIRIFQSEQSLDGTDIHPDDYKLAERMVATTELDSPAASPEGWSKTSPQQTAAEPPKVDGSESAATEATETNPSEATETPASADSSPDEVAAETAATQSVDAESTESGKPIDSDSRPEDAQEKAEQAPVSSEEPATSPSVETAAAPETTPDVPAPDVPAPEVTAPDVPAPEVTAPDAAATAESSPVESSPAESPVAESPVAESPVAESTDGEATESVSTSAALTPSADATATTPDTSQSDTSQSDASQPDASQPGVEPPAPTGTTSSEPTAEATEEKKPEPKKPEPKPLPEISVLELPMESAGKVDLDVEKLARGWQVGREKLKRIASSLNRPFADRRHQQPVIPLLTQVPSFDNVRPGMTAWAVVIGVAEFGVFAELGPDCSGLIHVSRLSSNYVEDPNQVVQTGDLIQVWIVNIDKNKRRIALSAIPPSERQSNAAGDDRGRRSRDDSRGDRNDPRGARGGNRPASAGGDSGTGDSRGGGDRSRGNSRGGGSGAGAGQGRGQGRSQGGQAGGGRRDGGGGGGGGRRDNRGRGNNRDRDRSRGPISYEAKSKLAPTSSEPISDAVQKGKEPMRSFGDLMQVYQTKREDVSEKAAEKRQSKKPPVENQTEKPKVEETKVEEKKSADSDADNAPTSDASES